MLRTRIITALLILPATILIVFFLPAWAFRIAMAVLLMIGCYEFSRLTNLNHAARNTLLAIQLLILALMLWQWQRVIDWAPLLLIAAAVSWLIQFYRLFQFGPGAIVDSRFRVTGFASALSSITFCWFALCWLRELPSGPFVVFMPMVIIWATDIGAYFAGRAFGKTKLAPLISPKKTREGVYGGVALAIVAAFIWAWPIANLPLNSVTIIALAFVTSVSSMVGDLFISVYKRTVGMKDAGTLFPGHGGVLDRYDSLLSGAPMFALVAWMLMA